MPEVWAEIQRSEAVTRSFPPCVAILSWRASLGQAAPCPRKHVLYGAIRSASDATTLLYTRTLVRRGPRTPPLGSVGSCVASYALFLAWILVKVFASVTENRYVALKCLDSKMSTGGGIGVTTGWFTASFVGTYVAHINVTTNFPSLRHVQLPTRGVSIPPDSMVSGDPLNSWIAVPSLCRLSWKIVWFRRLDPSPQVSGIVIRVV